jgi:hypothetical protein
MLRANVRFAPTRRTSTVILVMSAKCQELP